MAREQRKYTLDERREAIALAEEVGPAEAARRLNLPQGTVTCWRHLSRKAAAEGGEWPARAAPEPDDHGEEQAEAPPEAGRSKRTAKVYSPSQRAAALELAAKLGITAASRELGISRFSLYTWRRKAKLAAQGKADSPTSGPDPIELASKRDREILSMWREHPGLGPSQVKNQLRRKGIKVSTATVRRVMEDAGYRPPKARAKTDHDKRYEAVRPNHIWHLETCCS